MRSGGRRPIAGSPSARCLILIGEGNVLVEFGDVNFDANFGHAEDVEVGEDRCLPNLVRRMEGIAAYSRP
jgi:hypothetical protein